MPLKAAWSQAMWYEVKGRERIAQVGCSYDGEMVWNPLTHKNIPIKEALVSSLSELGFVHVSSSDKMEMGDLNALDKAGITFVNPSSFIREEFSISRDGATEEVVVYPAPREDKVLYVVCVGEEQLLFISHTFTSFLNDFVVGFRQWWSSKHSGTQVLTSRGAEG
jgi:hypothetical protein